MSMLQSIETGIGPSYRLLWTTTGDREISGMHRTRIGKISFISIAPRPSEREGEPTCLDYPRVSNSIAADCARRESYRES